MVELMTPEEFDKIKEKLEANELYKKSKSLHKDFQYRVFFDPFTEKAIEGQLLRNEDSNQRIECEVGFDKKSARVVIYNFRQGVLHSENGEPAVQYPGHWEYWDKGLLKKVVADGGDTEEYWEAGVPVRIETNLAERRRREVENGK